MGIPKFQPLANASEGTKKILKPILIGVIALLLGAFGLEATNNDWDIGKILSGQQVSETKLVRDEKGNIKIDSAGNMLTRVMRDKMGNIVSTNKDGAKYTDEYNCDDFKTQPEAQTFFKNAGGPSKDTNGLDGDNDGEACESLPKGK